MGCFPPGWTSRKSVVAKETLPRKNGLVGPFSSLLSHQRCQGVPATAPRLPHEKRRAEG